MNRARRRPEAGMTLVELMVAVGIFALVAAALTAILFSSTRLGTRTSARADVQATSRQAMSLLTTELRQAGLDPTIPPVGIVGIVSGDSTSVHVRADLNANGTLQTAEPSEDVTYTYVDSIGTLMRNPGTGSVAVMSGITDFRISYFDAANNPITTLPLDATNAALVRSIGISLTAVEGEAAPVTLTTRVTLRNR